MGGGAGITYLLRDEFTTAEASPIASPRTCEPGPGTLTIVENDGALNISAGSMVFTAQTTPAWGDLGVIGTALTRAEGLVLSVIRTQASNKYSHPISFQNLNALPNADTPANSDASFYIPATANVLASYNGNNGAVYVATLTTDVPHQYAIVLRSAGAYYLIKGGIYTEWTLVWVTKLGTTATLYPAIESYNAAGTADSLRVAQLSKPWSDTNGIATNITASANAGATTTSLANAIIEATWTAVTSETFELSVRRTDDDNRWVLRYSQADSTRKIIQIEGGVETERASGAITLTNGTAYNIVALCYGNTIQIGGSSLKYESATFNNTATGVKVSHAVTNLNTWPRTISGSALAELNRFLA
jgi:hypothetical protein